MEFYDAQEIAALNSAAADFLRQHRDVNRNRFVFDLSVRVGKYETFEQVEKAMGANLAKSAREVRGSRVSKAKQGVCRRDQELLGEWRDLKKAILKGVRDRKETASPSLETSK